MTVKRVVDTLISENVISGVVSFNVRELTNRRLSPDGAVESRHSPASSSCRNLNLRFSKDDDVCSRVANFPTVSEVCFYLFTR